MKKLNKGFTPLEITRVGKKHKEKESLTTGLTFLEVIFAIFIILIGVLGAFTVIQQILSVTSMSSFQVTAAYLSQEGIEIVRNIRDTNWLEEVAFDTGLGAGFWEADYTTQNLTDTYDGDFLNIDANGFYSYSAGNPTKFTRKITITPDPSGFLKVSVRVEWQEKGQTHSVTAEKNLYDWYQ